ncbi:MAG: hypothetical protein ACI8WB_000651 [Phenylobacterium sp.]
MKPFVSWLVESLLYAIIVALLVALTLWAFAQWPFPVKMALLITTFIFLLRTLYSPDYMMRRLAVKLIPLLLLSINNGSIIVKAIEITYGAINNAKPLPIDIKQSIESLLSYLGNPDYTGLILAAIVILALGELILNSAILEGLFHRKKESYLSLTKENFPDGGLFKSQHRKNTLTVKFKVAVKGIKNEGFEFPSLKAQELTIYCLGIISFKPQITRFSGRIKPDNVTAFVDLNGNPNSTVSIEYSLDISSRYFVLWGVVKTLKNGEHFLVRFTDSANTQYDLIF